jgi:hypothetical protein
MYNQRAISSVTLVLVALILALAGSLSFLIVSRQPSPQPVTFTSTLTQTASIVAIQSTTLIVTSTRSITTGNSMASALSTNGLELTVSTNASSLREGQSLEINAEIYNTLPKIDDLSAANEWAFRGLPVAVWSPCYYQLPLQIAVVEGNFTLGELNATKEYGSNITCFDSYTIDNAVFQPNSDQVNVTGIFQGEVNVNNTVGPFELNANVTTSGYWDLQNLSKGLTIPVLLDSQVPSIPFSPGIYTIAVEDEWGQAVVLNLTVQA